jgi:hypothetical protein
MLANIQQNAKRLPAFYLHLMREEGLSVWMGSGKAVLGAASSTNLGSHISPAACAHEAWEYALDMPTSRHGDHVHLPHRW